MATLISRVFASTPKRTASETWSVIMSVLAPDPKGAARAELQKVAGIAAAAIASEAPKDDAFIVYGSGPQIRAYCNFGEDAVTGDGVNEDSLEKSPTEGSWQLSIPCHSDDLNWMQRKLKELSTRVTARALGEGLGSDEANQASKKSAVLSLNTKEFLGS